MFSKYTSHTLVETQCRLRGGRPTDMRGARLMQERLIEAGLWRRESGGVVPAVPLGVVGYRSNEDGTETLAWGFDAAGRAVCVHAGGDGVCARCREADERIPA